jgi:NADPH2:quinone reductase
VPARNGIPLRAGTVPRPYVPVHSYMKAIRVHHFGNPDVMALETVPELVPGPGQVVVRVKATGVNPVDTYIRAGVYGERPFPYTPGMDAGGTVIAVGAGVSRLKMNDRVYVAGSISGTYAEQVQCKESQVHPLPSHTSFEQGAAMGVPYATASYALFHRGHAMAGETVLVHGASGGVGTAALQLARSYGLTVIGTGGTPKGRDLVAKEGAHHVLDHSAPNYLDQLMTLTSGRGVDLVLEMLANVTLGKDLKILAPRGRVVVVGNRGNVDINPRDIMGKNADIRGMSLMTVTEQELSSVHAALVAGLENGTLRPVIGQKLLLAEAIRSHEEVMKSGAYGKIVLVQ